MLYFPECDASTFIPSVSEDIDSGRCLVFKCQNRDECDLSVPFLDSGLNSPGSYNFTIINLV